MTIADIWDRYGSGYPGAKKPVVAPVGGDGLYPSTVNPGKGAFGEVPGSVDIPRTVSSSIQRDLSGVLSPEVQSKLQQIAATWGIKNGMPGSGAQTNLYKHDYLGASDAARQRGFENWKSLVPLEQQNRELAAAPNPQTRALTEQSFAQQMFNQYLAAMRGGGGGQGGGARSPAGGTGAMAQPESNPRTGPAFAPNPYMPAPVASPQKGSVNPQDDFEFYPEMWGGLLDNSPSWSTANSDSDFVNLGASTAPGAFDDQYWNDVFGM